MKTSDKIEIWKQIVAVQMHFNELAMKIRNFFITMVFALLASMGFLLEKKLNIEFLGITVYAVIFIPFAGIVGSYLFYFMDRHWYHRLLLGSVKQGIVVENSIENSPEIKLTNAIGKESPVELDNWFQKFVFWLTVFDKKSRDERKIHSNGKIEFFYISIMYLFLLLFIFGVLFGGVRYDGKSIAVYLWSLLPC